MTRDKQKEDIYCLLKTCLIVFSPIGVLRVVWTVRFLPSADRENSSFTSTSSGPLGLLNFCVPSITSLSLFHFDLDLNSPLPPRPMPAVLVFSWPSSVNF